MPISDSRERAFPVESKGVPIVGMGIGAGWNWLEASAVGRRAIAYHTGQPIAEDRLRTIGKKLNPARLLPERWRRKKDADRPTLEDETKPG